jgi:hypothetical protein
MSFSSLDHTVAPDIFTASPEYDRRFSGPVGEYFLEVQKQAVLLQLKRISSGPLSILEIGGGHLQMTKEFIQLGHSVIVHGSSEEALNKLNSSSLADKVEKLVCPIQAINQTAKRTDVVVALRLIPHVIDEGTLLLQMVRLAKKGLIFDFASTQGLNGLSKLAFGIKKKIEKNTRPYFNHSPLAIKKTLESQHCLEIEFSGQFVFPMGLHRALKNVPASKLIESIARPVRDIWGNPIICGAKVNG